MRRQFDQMRLLRGKTVLGVAVFGIIAVCVSFMATAAAPTLQITSPSTGVTATQGSIVPVTVAVTGTPVSGVVLYASDGSIAESSSASPPYAISLPLSTATIGPVTVTAVAIAASGQILATSTPVVLDVEPPAGILPQSLECASPKLTYVGEQEALNVVATQSDGSVLRVNGSARLLFNSQNSTVLTIDATGNITAVGPGTATLTVTFGAVTCTSNLAVPTAIKGDLNDDGIVDSRDLNILLPALNTTDSTPKDARDLNGDGKIDIKDARILASLCKQTHCGITMIPDDSILQQVFEH
jgi:hypothetical protein